MRLVIDLAFKTLIILGLNWLGWITLKSEGAPIKDDPKQLVGTAIVVAVIFLIVSVLLLIFTLGFAGLLMVFLGGAVLYLVGEFAPDFISLTNFWYTVIGGFLIMAASLPERLRQRNTSSTRA